MTDDQNERELLRMLPDPVVLVDEPPVPVDRGWAREILARAGASQKELAREWGMSEANTSRWLDGKLSRDLSMMRAAAFCRLTGTPIEEMFHQMGLVTTADGARIAPPKPGTPPLGTVDIQHSEGSGAAWRLHLYLELSAEYLGELTQALDRIAKAKRARRAARIVAKR